MTKSRAIKVDRPQEYPGVAIVSMCRAEVRNAINDDVIEGLTQAAVELRQDASIQVIILTGEGGFFSAGADFSTFENFADEKDVNVIRHWASGGKTLCSMWENLPQLTIAAIEGGAVGGGLGFAVSCDWRVMASDAWAYVPEARLGLNYGWSTLPRLTNLIGPARTKTLSILCRRHSASECENWGLVDSVSKPGESMAMALELAQEVLQAPRLSARIIKKAINTKANALTESTSYADVDELLVCMTDPEGNKAREALVKNTGKRK